MISPQLFRRLEKLPEDVKDALLSFAEEMVKTVTKDDFNELKRVVQELSRARWDGREVYIGTTHRRLGVEQERHGGPKL